MARDRRKTLKNEKEKRKMRKRQKITINIFIPLFFYIEKIIFCYKTYLEKPSLYCYICMSFFG